MSGIALPTFAQLKKHYPTDGSSQVKAALGLTADWLGSNTCVMRMSKAFNYAAGANFAIPGNYPGMVTAKGSDKLNYAIRVQEFITYLSQHYHAANIIKEGDAIEKNAFLGHTGIISWSVVGFDDATGHFTLWDGLEGLYTGGINYWSMPTRKLPLVHGVQREYVIKSQLWIC
jgi:hypothetical protein